MKRNKEFESFDFSYKDKAKLLKMKFKKIKPLRSITKKQPSELLKYHILNILYPFLFYYRFQNGDILINPPVFNFDNAKDIQDSLSL